MKGCCVFWIPTIYHQQLERLTEESQFKEDISDEVGTPCHMEIDLQSEDLISINLNINNYQSIQFSLQREEPHKNGLFLYRFEIKNDKDFNIVEKALKNPIYHRIKGLYHRHRYHSSDSDSILDAFVCQDDNQSVTLNCPDNAPLVHYLQQYEKKFKNFEEQLEYDVHCINKEEKDERYAYIVLREKYEYLILQCNNILGESIYYKSLFNSKYNHSFRLKTLNTQDDNNLYKSAINIENAIAQIKLISENIKTTYHRRISNATLKNTENIIDLQLGIKGTLSQGEKISNRSLKLAWLSVGLGLIGLISLIR